jgi:type II secretory ATPase GspE/PulE/Tfp pilus assembly ATPase PilB-like protein
MQKDFLATIIAPVVVELSRVEHSSISMLVDRVINEAHSLRASDIHICPGEDRVRIRLRIDGVLEDKYVYEKLMHSEIISRIKVLAALRTDEHQAAQDGRFRIGIAIKDKIDVRVSITPTYYGENAVLRLLGNKSETFTLSSLGFSDRDRHHIEHAIKKPHGMILSTGPTGSGKTTTLYTLIRMLSTPGVSIVTIEDPIECAMEGVTQIQINPRTGLTFANGLRSILRQDPNIIMVGEIRDSETAGIAINTALTGHLLLSTLHTSDAATTLPRLLDMGIDAYLVASTVDLVIGQRLIRRICGECKQEYRLSTTEQSSLSGLFPNNSKRQEIFFHGVGCSACGGSGFKGRIGINEVMVVDGDIHEAILKKTSAAGLKEIAKENGMTTMLEDGLAKACVGDTTIGEILRTINE